MNYLRLAVWAVLLPSVTACLGRVTLAPHLNRERELAPDAAAERHSAVLDRAAAFEKQNAKSRDIYWYRAWRASAMIGLSQHDLALDLLQEIQRDMTTAKSPPAQSDRLRMFIYDLEARAYLETGRSAEALGRLERALPIAREVSLETSGACDREIMLAARHRALMQVAAATGESDRSTKAKVEIERHLERWSRCLAAIDYPSMAVTESLVEVMSSAAPVPVRSAPPRAAPPPRAALPVRAPPPATSSPPAAPPGRLAIAALPLNRGRYAPVSPRSHAAGFDALEPMLTGPLAGASTSLVIRTDGAHHALLVSARQRVAAVEDLFPSLRSLVVFFETTRGAKPKVTHVIVDAGGEKVLAKKDDVMALFLDRIDAKQLRTRLARIQ